MSEAIYDTVPFTFKKGEIVRLKSAAATMTIMGFVGPLVRVVWLDATLKIVTADLPPEVLILSPSDAGSNPPGFTG